MRKQPMIRLCSLLLCVCFLCGTCSAAGFGRSGGDSSGFAAAGGMLSASVSSAGQQTQDSAAEELYGTPLSFEITDNALVQEALEQTGREAPEIEDASPYDAQDTVRVSIFLEEQSTLEVYPDRQSLTAPLAMEYRSGLADRQQAVTHAIEQVTDDPLDVVWNMTLAVNAISANVRYGQIAEIEAVPGVRDVVIETRYLPQVVDQALTADPQMSTSGSMIGTTAAWAAGYTGAGTRIAVIDTGTDTDHQSFSEEGYLYALKLQAQDAGMEPDAYLESLNLLDSEEISAVWDSLNISSRVRFSPEAAYLNAKLPFAVNYVDNNLNVTHDLDSQGEHGSHVAGIATANAYVPTADGGFADALSETLVCGAAPDAQLLTLKVFGKSGGAYDSDYMAAIEDAIVLGADAINLSLGTATAGFTNSGNGVYQTIMNNLTVSDAVVSVSQGNNSTWQGSDLHIGYLYADEVNMNTGGAPASYVNSLAVASADNVGRTGYSYTVGDTRTYYIENMGYGNLPLTTVGGSREYVYLDGNGTAEEWAALREVLEGRVAVCSRGAINFAVKANGAVENGAIATIIYNNQAGNIALDLTGYAHTAPCVSISQTEGLALKANGQEQTLNGVTFYLGTINIGSTVESVMTTVEYAGLSSFSSWGVPGSLILKPEITAPGGNIYSVDGSVAGGTAYENMSGTSMAAPQIAGMSALMAQYLKEQNLPEKTGRTARQLSQSLLMSTALPMRSSSDNGNYYPVFAQGAGLANVNLAISADSYLMMGEDATASAADGKIKAELGDDPERVGEYTFSFTLYNLTDSQQSYDLSAELFTQAQFTGEDGYAYLDTGITALDALTTWVADGVPVAQAADLTALDFDGNGKTDLGDADALMAYVLEGTPIFQQTYADLDGDGDVDTYDVHLLLRRISTGMVTVAAGSDVTVQVTLTLTDSQKAALDADYVNGAYLEGYLFVNGRSTAEGVAGTRHSIPVFGFYGNWSDPSMYEDITYAEYIYGDTKVPHTGQVETNNLIVRYGEDSTACWLVDNPVLMEETFRPERRALGSDDTLSQYRTTLIRNPAAMVAVAQDSDGEILYINPVTTNIYGSYYIPSYLTWYNTVAGMNLNLRVGDLGVAENESITLSLVAIPEYYENGDLLTETEIRALIDNDVLGHGAYLSTTFTVDDTAPVMTEVLKNLQTGALSISARDNQYIAAVSVTDKTGSQLIAQVLPEQTDAGADTTTVVELAGSEVGDWCYVVITDYANNTSTYRVDYGEPIDYRGRLYGFSADRARGSGAKWMQIDPDTLYYYDESHYGGTRLVADMERTITAAEYVKGYVYMAADDGNLYVAEQGDWNHDFRVGSYADVTATIYDMAYSEADGVLYALGENSTVYSVDPITGQLTRQFTVSVTKPAAAAYRKLTALAIDGSGTFYAVNNSGNNGYGSYKNAYLYSWNWDQVEDGAVSSLAPVSDTPLTSSRSGYGPTGSLAWDREADILYWANHASAYSSYLWIVDPATGKASPATTEDGGQGSTFASLLYNKTSGLYIVPEASGQIGTSQQATSVILDQTALTLLPGCTVQLNADVYPWNLENTDVTWRTSDASVAAVEAGAVTAVSVGDAVITVTTAAEPHLTAQCSVTVVALDDLTFSGLLYDETGIGQWADFHTGDLQSFTPIESDWDNEVTVLSGALMEDILYVHDGGNVYGIDADTFRITDCGPLAEEYCWSDAAQAPETEDGSFGYLLAIAGYGTLVELLDPTGTEIILWDRSSTFADDPMAAVAYVSSGTYSNKPAHWYYMLTEGGRLWSIIVSAVPGGSYYYLSMQELGDTGLRLPDTSIPDARHSVSMTFDASGYLLLSACIPGFDQAQVYAIDPVNTYAYALGGTGTDYPALVSLYQYDRLTDVAVILRDQETACIYAGDTVQLNAEVKPLRFTDGVVWESSDPDVATVDETGLVTGIRAGTATITASYQGRPDAFDTTEVTVLPLSELDATVYGQVTDRTGTHWVKIDTDTMTYEIVQDAETQFAAGGAGDGVLYGADGDYTSTSTLYRVDPDNGYAETELATAEPGMIPVDISYAPRMDNTADNGDGFTCYGQPVYLTDGDVIVLADEDLNIVQSMDLSPSGWEPATMAHVLDANIEYGTSVKYSIFLGLAPRSGSLYMMFLAPDYAAGDYSTTIAASWFGYTSLTFSDPTALSMTHIPSESGYGTLLISDATDGGLYYVSLDDYDDMGNQACGKLGRLSGVTNLTALYGADLDDADADAALGAQLMELAQQRQALRSDDGGRSSAPIERTTAYDYRAAFLTQDDGVWGGSLFAVSGNTAAAVAESDSEIVVSLTARNAQGVEVASTNGQMLVTYDPSVLELTAVQGGAAQVFGSVCDTQTVTVGYAHETALSVGVPVAALHFVRKTDADTQITILHMEQGDTSPDYRERLTLSLEPEQPIRPVAPTEPVTPVSPVTPVTPATPDVPEQPQPIFTDVPAGSWYEDAALWAVEQGITTGIGDHLFAPDQLCDRAQAVTFLYRAAGSPAVEHRQTNFTDVTPGSYYENAVLWAVEQGITKGTGDGSTFSPELVCNRAQIVTFLYRFLQIQGDIPMDDAGADLSAYLDAQDIPAYALTAMRWAVNAGVMQGNGTYLMPEKSCTRAEIVTLLFRVLTR